jgi:hypothetical protein
MPHSNNLTDVPLDNIVVTPTIRNRAALCRQRRLCGCIVRARSRRADGIGNRVRATRRTATGLLNVVEVVADTEDVGVPGEELGLRYVGVVFFVYLADGGGTS